MRHPIRKHLRAAGSFDLPVPAHPLEEGCAFGVPDGDAYADPLGGQALDDSATEESRSSEYGYTFGRHQVPPQGWKHNPNTVFFLCRLGYA